MDWRGRKRSDSDPEGSIHRNLDGIDPGVVRAIKEYDRLGPERFFSEHGFAPTTTNELVWEERRYPPKAILAG